MKGVFHKVTDFYRLLDIMKNTLVNGINIIVISSALLHSSRDGSGVEIVAPSHESPCVSTYFSEGERTQGNVEKRDKSPTDGVSRIYQYLLIAWLLAPI